MSPINYEDLSDFEELPSVNDILSSKSVGQEKLTDLNTEVIALDTEIDDPDQTQMPIGYGNQMKELEEMFSSDPITEISSHTDLGGGEDDAGAEYGQFMQSQHIVIDPDVPNLPSVDCEEFVHSDEELSELEYFMSIEQLLAKGGDERRRAEFILKQFNKNTGVDGPQRNLSKLTDGAGGSRKAVQHLGARRSRKLFGK